MPFDDETQVPDTTQDTAASAIQAMSVAESVLPYITKDNIDRTIILHPTFHYDPEFSACLSAYATPRARHSLLNTMKGIDTSQTVNGIRTYLERKSQAINLPRSCLPSVGTKARAQRLQGLETELTQGMKCKIEDCNDVWPEGTQLFYAQDLDAVTAALDGTELEPVALEEIRKAAQDHFPLLRKPM